jgi:protein-S-isoprenylcysteine O-methyltransferase Ste14
MSTPQASKQMNRFWLWVRAILYMLVVGGGWLLVLPAILLLIEQGRIVVSWRSFPWLIVGAGMGCLGLLLAWYAAYYLVEKGQGTPFPLDPTHVLVTGGPYRYVRNPQAIAMLLLSSGEVVAVESRVLWVLIPLTLLYLEGIAGPWEQRELEARYGRAYLDYQRRVPRWIPRWYG